MKYGVMGAVVPLIMKKIASGYLKQKAPDASLAEIKKEYKAVIERQPEIGGRKNNLIMGLYFAAYFMSLRAYVWVKKHPMISFREWYSIPLHQPLDDTTPWAVSFVKDAKHRAAACP